MTDRLGSQGTVCAGGRYDYLFEQLGGKSAPAVGWALGVDRVLELARASSQLASGPVPHAYAIVGQPGDLPSVLKTLQQLRHLGVQVQMAASSAEGMGSMKSQFKRADASGARFALIFGPDEVAADQLTIKSLREGGAQTLHTLADLPQWAATLQSPV